MATCDQLEVMWVDGLCEQLHQGDMIAGSHRTHVEQGAAMNATYEYSLEFQLVQYNESNCPS